MNESKKNLILELHKLGIIKFGQFTLKSGLLSPFYIDFRIIISHPQILKALASQIWLRIENLKFDHLCGVPYAALPLSTAISIEHLIPQLIKRKEKKKYGTAKSVEGVFEKNDVCLVIEDIITSGASLLETTAELEKEGLQINHLISLLDRQQGGNEVLKNAGYEVISIFTITDVINALQDENKITKEEFDLTLNFIQNNKVASPANKAVLDYPSIKAVAKHPKNIELLNIIESKKSNLCCSADVTTKKELLQLIENVGENICLLKTHIDIIQDFDYDLIEQLKALSRKYNFLILEDRKFADIGNTALHQFTSGIYKISDWADAITYHVIAGSSSIDAIRQSENKNNTGLILITEMSTKDTLTDKNYIQGALDISKSNPDLVMGIVAQKNRPLDNGQLLFTPGIKLQSGSDTMGQVYNTPENAILKNNTDVIIVGRGIYKSDDPKHSSTAFKSAGWESYLQRI